MNKKKLVFEQIHMGQRLQHFVSKAPHGMGAIAVASLLNIGKTTIYNAYQRQTLDLVEIEKICAFYDLSLFEFLGIGPEKIPESFKSKPTNVPDLGSINEKLDVIIEHVTKQK